MSCKLEKRTRNQYRFRRWFANWFGRSEIVGIGSSLIEQEKCKRWRGRNLELSYCPTLFSRTFKIRSGLSGAMGWLMGGGL